MIERFSFRYEIQIEPLSPSNTVNLFILTPKNKTLQKFLQGLS